MATKKLVSRSYYREADSSDESENKVKFSNAKLRNMPLSPKDLKNNSPKKKDKKIGKKSAPKKSYQDDLLKNYFSKGNNEKAYSKKSTPARQDATLSNLARKELHDDSTLKAKLANLQKSVLVQEKALNDIKQKLNNEKPDYYSLQDHTTKKSSNGKGEEEKSILKRTSIGRPKESENVQNRQSVVSKKSIAEDYIKNDGASEKESSEDEKSYFDLRKSQRNYFSANVSDTTTFKERRRDLLEEELEKKGEETVLQKKKVNEMKTFIKDLTRKYEHEIDNLKTEMHILSEQNFKMRNHAISGKDQKKIEELYAKRIKDLEEAVSFKDREIAEKEGYYKSQMEDIKIKMEELQREVRKIEDYEDKVEELTQQVQLKDKEMEIIKKYYTDKLQGKTDEQIKQKKEWSNANNDLLLEVRNLRREVDLLQYENKKLGGNRASLNMKEELNFMSSRRVGYDV